MKFEEMKNDELHNWCKLSGGKSLKWRKQFIAALPEVFQRHLYKKYGYGSIFEYAAKLGGVSRDMVQDVIRVDKRLEKMPKLKALMPEVGLSKLRRVASIAEKKNEDEWVEKVQKMSKPALEIHIRDIRKSRPGPSKPVSPEKPIYDKKFETFSIKLDSKVILKLKIIKHKMRKGATWNEVFEKLTDLPEPKPQKNPRPAKPQSRQASTKQKREALAQTNGKCGIEGCNNPAEEIHHEKPWSIFKSHKKLLPRCKPHHELDHQSDNTVDKKFRAYKLQASLF